MSEFDLSPLRKVLAAYAPQGGTALLPALHVAQSIYGYLPEPVAAEIGRVLRVPLADIYGVIDFYAMFYRHPVGNNVALVCGDPACAIQGSLELIEQVRGQLNVNGNGISQDGEWTIERAPCLGLCDHAPAALIGALTYSQLDPNKPRALLEGNSNQIANQVGGDIRILTKNCGMGKITNLSKYLGRGGYTGLKKALQEMDPESVIRAIKESGLVGRGGAAFPTGIKWEGAAQAVGNPKYVVCNADESEPGTFKDRILMEDDPHSTLEGMAIAGFAIGSNYGYIYIRGEYPRATQVLQEAIKEATKAGYLGKNILDTGFDFHIEIRRGAGAYICGEETALFESIEGKRGFPRIKPPFPTTNGLFGKPTAINNVETLFNVPMIIKDGAAAYRQLGTEKSPGSKLFCLSGDVAKPGLYEVPFGVTLRHLLNDLAGGVVGGDLQTILFGGAAGAFATPDQLDVKMTFEDLRAAGLPLGSGVVMVFNEHRNIIEILKGLAHFFADESCGKCYPCQLGTQRQFEVLSRMDRGQTREGDRQRLEDVGWTMVDSSLCGLGQTAATAVLSAIEHWPHLFSSNGNSGQA